MFWRFGGYASLSTIDNILDKPDVTLEELLDESDLIQELKQHNSKLIEYLRDENVLKRLLEYVVAPKPGDEDCDNTTAGDDAQSSSTEDGGSSRPTSKGKSRAREFSEEDQEKEEKARVKYAYVACEVLSCDVWSLLEALLENRQHLERFWQFMRREPPLDPVQAGYFTKVNEMLLDKKTEEMIEFLRTLEWVVPAMLQHVDCPMVMDLLLKIISLEKSEGGQGIVEWLHSQDLIPILLSYLSPKHSSATQTSAGDFLKAIITISANASQNEQSCIGPNDLTRQLVSEHCVTALITDMLRGGNPLTVGVGIIIEVIRKNNSDYDPDVSAGADALPSSRDPIYLGTLLRIFAKHVPDFMALILSPTYTVINEDGTTTTKKRELKAAFGEVIEPLGFDRFKTCELMAELLHCSNMGLLNERGSEKFVKERDEERERLKAEGNLPVSRDGPSMNDLGDDGPLYANGQSQSRDGSDSPEDIRKLEVQNAGEDDGFEDVTVSGDLNDEVKDDFDEKPDHESEAQDPTKHFALQSDLDNEDDFVDEALSAPPIEPGSVEKAIGDGIAALPGDAPAVIQPLSPTKSDLTANVEALNVDKERPFDAVQSSTTPASSKSHLHAELPPTTGTLSPSTLSPHPEDQPAPLFANRNDQSSSPAKDEDATPEVEQEGTGEGSQGTLDTTLPEGMESELMSGNDLGFESQTETDLDGSPVVGDFLKLMFVEHKVVPTILDFFFRFPWNNFLHNVVYDVVQQVFNGPMERGYNRTLAADLFDTGRITERIVEGQQRSDKAQEENNMRLGYMGHLTLIAEEVVKFTERHPPELLSKSVLEKVMDSQWSGYVERTLAETRERDNAILGGVRPDMSVGPRQAVLNAVQAAGGFGGGASAALANAGLTGGGVSALEGVELGNGSSTTSGGYGGSLLSGFGSSSDEEDEDMEEGEEDERTAGINSDQLPENDTEDSSAISQPSVPPPPPPLNVPSRARRQLQARLALHSRQQAEKDAAAEEAGTASSSSDPSASTRDQDLNSNSNSDYHHPSSSFDGADEPEHWDDVQNEVESHEALDEDDEDEDEDEDEDDREPEPEGLTMASSTSSSSTATAPSSSSTSSATPHAPGKRRMSSTSVATVRSAIEEEDEDTHVISSAEKEKEKEKEEEK